MPSVNLQVPMNAVASPCCSSSATQPVVPSEACLISSRHKSRHEFSIFHPSPRPQPYPESRRDQTRNPRGDRQPLIAPALILDLRGALAPRPRVGENAGNLVGSVVGTHPEVSRYRKPGP